MTKEIERKTIENHPDYSDMMETESHHKHLIEDVDGVWRWKENEKIRNLVDKIGLNEIWLLLYFMDLNKNSEIVRKLYRDIGYSLSGYYDIFYWDVNNDLAHEYNPSLATKIEGLSFEEKTKATIIDQSLKELLDKGLITLSQFKESRKFLLT